VDDIITKSMKEVDYVSYLEEAFMILRCYCMELNPRKPLRS